VPIVPDPEMRMRPLPTVQPTAASTDVRVCAMPATLSRRDFVSAAAWSMLSATLAGACGGGGDGPTDPGGGTTPSGSGVTVNGGIITIALDAEAALAAANGFLILNQARTIVINTGGNVFRAFTSVCTHEQCDVNGYSGGRIRCPCHGSQYDTRGQVVVGPATLPLTEYQASFNAATRTVTVARG
jgi:cytochrome b6-f complex iron-sulfur subunit